MAILESGGRFAAKTACDSAAPRIERDLTAPVGPTASSGDGYVDDDCHVCAHRLGCLLTPAKCLEMVRDLLLFPCGQRGIENGVHRKMLLAPRKPGRCVIKPHDGE